MLIACVSERSGITNKHDLLVRKQRFDGSLQYNNEQATSEVGLYYPRSCQRIPAIVQYNTLRLVFTVQIYLSIGPDSPQDLKFPQCHSVHVFFDEPRFRERTYVL